MSQEVSHANLTAYTKAFSTFDKDNDGRITTSELKNIIASLGLYPSENEVKTMLAEVSGDGKTDSITLPEFIMAMEKSFRDERLNTELLQSFEVFDIDGDGFITFSELKQVMADKFRSSDATDANIRAMIEKADTDGDGRVNYSEFVQLMST